MRLWGDEDGTSGGGKEHFYRINVLPSWTLDDKTLTTHSDCRQDTSNPDTSSAECHINLPADKTSANFKFVNADADHYNVYLDVNGTRVVSAPNSANIGTPVALSLNVGTNLLRVQLATKSHDHVPENYYGDAFYYRINVGTIASIEAVKSPVVEGEEEVPVPHNALGSSTCGRRRRHGGNNRKRYFKHHRTHCDCRLQGPHRQHCPRTNRRDPRDTDHQGRHPTQGQSNPRGHYPRHRLRRGLQFPGHRASKRPRPSQHQICRWLRPDNHGPPKEMARSLST